MFVDIILRLLEVYLVGIDLVIIIIQIFGCQSIHIIICSRYQLAQEYELFIAQLDGVNTYLSRCKLRLVSHSVIFRIRNSITSLRITKIDKSHIGRLYRCLSLRWTRTHSANRTLVVVIDFLRNHFTLRVFTLTIEA